MTTGSLGALGWMSPRARNMQQARRRLRAVRGLGFSLDADLIRGDWFFLSMKGPMEFGTIMRFSAMTAARRWKCGENVPGAMIVDAKGAAHSQINEVQIAELSDGSLRLNSRGNSRARKFGRLRSARTAGRLGRRSRIFRSFATQAAWGRCFDFRLLKMVRRAFCFTAGRTARDARMGRFMRAWMRATWPVKRVLYKGGFAYSVLMRLPDGAIGCLFEADK